MIIKYKSKIVFKICILLCVLILLIGLIGGTVTICRYLTQQNLDVNYYAKSAPVIYMGQNTVTTDTLFEITGWQSTLNKTSADFTFKNVLSDNAPEQDIMFSLRVCIVETGNINDNQEGILPVQVDLNSNGSLYRSDANTFNEETLFHQYSKLKGEFYTFTDIENPNDSEAVFCLKGGTDSEIDFNITIYNLQSEYQKVYLYVKRI